MSVGDLCLALVLLCSLSIIFSFAIVSMRKRERVALHQKSPGCHVDVSVVCLFLTVGWSAVCDCCISGHTILNYWCHWERSGSVVECLTRDRRIAGSSLTGVTALWSLSKTHLS